MVAALKEAFALTSTPYHAIANLCSTIQNNYDYAGFIAYRALMDDKFLAVPAGKHHSASYNQAVNYYDMARSKAVEWVLNTATIRTAAGDVGPKPDIKPGLLNAAKASLPYLSRINWSSPFVMGAVCLAAAFATYAMSQTGAGHQAADAVGTLYASAPHPVKPAGKRTSKIVENETPVKPSAQP